MWFFNCWWWWLGLGALLGWLCSWWLCRRARANQPVLERTVERIVERQVDNPAHVTRIAALEADISGMTRLRAELGALKSAPPRTVEKIVERLVDRPVDRIVERIVDRPVDNPAHVSRIAALELELEGLRARSVTLDQAAAKAAGFSVKGMDDLVIIEGIGPKIAELLHRDSIHTFAELARTSIPTLQGILSRAGSNFQLAKPDSWPQQAELAADNRWQELRKLQDELDAGVRK